MLEICIYTSATSNANIIMTWVMRGYVATVIACCSEPCSKPHGGF